MNASMDAGLDASMDASMDAIGCEQSGSRDQVARAPLNKEAVRRWLLARQRTRAPLPERAVLLRELQALAAAVAQPG